MRLIWALGVVLALDGSARGQAAIPQAAPAAITPEIYRIGGKLKAPVPLSMPQADYSKEASKKKISGNVLIGLVVDSDGNPQQVHVVRSLADELGKKELKAALSRDAKAVEAVKQYRFSPAIHGGTSSACRDEG